MDLDDYTAPVDFDAEFAPRPRAEQQAARAAAKAARATLEERPAPRTPAATSRQQQYIVGAVGVLAVVGVLALALSQMTDRPMATATPAPTAPTALPAFAPAPPAMPTPEATIPAYAAPDGVVLGQIELSRAMEPVAHYGNAWIQANVADSGLVWLRAADLPGVTLTGPDLAPRPAPPVARPAPAQSWSAPVVEVQAAPAPAEEPVSAGVKDLPASDWCRGSHLDNPECAGANSKETR